jgi:predicted transcriptional regulator of viral defense system
MVMKKTILSEKDLEIIEEIILSAGKVADSKQIMDIIRKKYSLSGAKKRMAQLAHAGWLIKLKRGLYQVVTDISGLKTGDMTLFNAASSLNHDSYISFESALQYHGLFDQMLSGVYSVTFRRARKYKMNNSDIIFFKIKKALFFGYEETEYNGYKVNIASREKALLDMLYYHSDFYHAGLVWDILREHKDTIDRIKFSGYAGRFGADVIRQAGFFMERLGFDFNSLLKKSSGFKGYSRMTKDSKELNAKWRLYFDDKVVK